MSLFNKERRQLQSNYLLMEKYFVITHDGPTLKVTEYSKDELQHELDQGKYKGLVWTDHVPDYKWFPSDTVLIIKGTGIIPKQVLKYTI